MDGKRPKLLRWKFLRRLLVKSEKILVNEKVLRRWAEGVTVSFDEKFTKENSLIHPFRVLDLVEQEKLPDAFTCPAARTATRIGTSDTAG